MKKSEQEGSQPPEWEAYKTEAEAKAAEKCPMPAAAAAAEEVAAAAEAAAATRAA